MTPGLPTAGPIDGAGQVHLCQGLESFGLLPKTDQVPALDLATLTSLPGNQWLKK